MQTSPARPKAQIFSSTHLASTCTLLFLALSISVNFLSPKHADWFIALTILLSFALPYGSSVKDLFRSTAMKTICILFGSWVLVNIIGYATNSGLGPDQIEELLGLRWFLVFLGMSIVGARLPQLHEKTEGLVAIGQLTALAGTLYHFILTTDPYPRFEGLLGNANLYAVAMLIPWSYLLGHILNKNTVRTRAQRIFSYTALAVFSFIILGTMTRGVWVSCLGCLFLVPLFHKNKAFYKVSAAVALLIAIAVLLNVAGLKDRIFYSFNFSSSSSQGIRFAIWKMNWDMFLKHPVVGVGYFESYRFMPAYFDVFGRPGGEMHHHAHNQYLQTLTGSGLLGFGIYLAMWTLIIRYFYKAARRLQNSPLQGFALGGLMVSAAYLFSSFTDCSLFMHSARNFMLIFLGLSFGVLQQNIEPKKTTSSQS